MKAIVKAHKECNVAKFNGLTFEVKEVLSNLVCLKVFNVSTDFTHREVFIVDIQDEMQKAYDNFNFGSDLRTYPNLNMYCITNKININKLTYNCPA